MAEKIIAVVSSALTTVALWFAIFHVAGHVRVGMLIGVFFMGVAIPLQLFASKKRRERNEIKSVVFRRGTSKWSLVIGAALGALFWWLAFWFLPHSR